MRLQKLLLGGAAVLLGTAPAGFSQEAKAEKRLDELLRPAAKIEGSGLRDRPMRWTGPQAVEQPDLPLPVYRGAPPHPGVPARKPLVPRPLPEGSPLAADFGTPQPPVPVELPTQPLVRLFTPDPNVPLDVPILAKPQPDRASLADPTLEASVAAALTKQSPARTQPVPFTPMSLPDPFENVRVGRLQNPPDEDNQPVPVPVQTPPRR